MFRATYWNRRIGRSEVLGVVEESGLAGTNLRVAAESTLTGDCVDDVAREVEDGTLDDAGTLVDGMRNEWRRRSIDILRVNEDGPEGVGMGSVSVDVEGVRSARCGVWSAIVVEVDSGELNSVEVEMEWRRRPTTRRGTAKGGDRRVEETSS